MMRFRLVLSAMLVFALIAVVAAFAGRSTTAEMTDGIPARSFAFTYRVHVPANPDSAGPTHLWIPLPQADAYQDIRGLHIDSPVSYAIQACNATSNPTNSFRSTAPSPSLPGSTLPVIPPPSKRPAISTITCSPPCAMTNPAKAGAAATPSGHALQSVATAPISILC